MTDMNISLYTDINLMTDLINLHIADLIFPNRAIYFET